MDFYKAIKEILTMKQLKSLAWKVSGEDWFKPERVQVRFEDSEGTVFELVIHSNPNLCSRLINQEEVILNVAFSHFGIIPKGEWIGVTTDISGMVNKCRGKAVYDGAFFPNEDKCLWNEFECPIHIF